MINIERKLTLHFLNDMEMIIETYNNLGGENSHNSVRCRPVAGHGYDPNNVKVQCSTRMRQSVGAGKYIKIYLTERHFENGTAVANFPMATSESYKNREGTRVDQNEWHNVVAWRKLAEIAESYLRKGSQIYLEGKLRTKSWEDQHGNKRYSTEIVADTFTILGKREDNQNGSDPSNKNTSETSQPDKIAEKDNIPF